MMMMFEVFSLVVREGLTSVSQASTVAQEDAKLQTILSEKKLEQLKRAKERRLKE